MIPNDHARIIHCMLQEPQVKTKKWGMFEIFYIMNNGEDLVSDLLMKSGKIKTTRELKQERRFL